MFSYQEINIYSVLPIITQMNSITQENILPGCNPKRNCVDIIKYYITGESMKTGDEATISNALRELFKVMTVSAELEEKKKIKVSLELILKECEN
jgi:hypothetical protein